MKRIEGSKLLLNLDHPDFNSKREQLCYDIAEDVRIFVELPPGAQGRETITAKLRDRLSAKAPFSSAARFYLQLHRNYEWVDKLLATT